MAKDGYILIDDSEMATPEINLPEREPEAPMWYEALAKLNTSMLLDSVGDKADQNAVTSAASLYLLLGLAMNATAGKTQKQIKDLIAKGWYQEAFNNQMKDFQFSLNKQFKGGELHLANGIVLNESIADRVKEEFAQIMKQYYKTELIAGKNGEVLSLINDWAGKNTNGMIPKLLNQVPADFKMCLLNAVAFEAKWMTPYEDDQIVENDEFTNADGTTSQVTMLSSSEDTFVENDFYTGFIKPYKGKKYALMALLPKKAKSKTFLKRAIENTDFRELFKSGRDADVSVEMPEFEIESSMDLRETISKLGVDAMFTSKANFSGMIDDEKIMVDSILQKAYIKVNREGTKAAAVSAMVCVAGCAPDFDRFKYVRLDRPFAYAVMEIETGVPVFAGVVNQL